MTIIHLDVSLAFKSASNAERAKGELTTILSNFLTRNHFGELPYLLSSLDILGSKLANVLSFRLGISLVENKSFNMEMFFAELPQKFYEYGKTLLLEDQSGLVGHKNSMGLFDYRVDLGISGLHYQDAGRAKIFMDRARTRMAQTFDPFHMQFDLISDGTESHMRSVKLSLVLDKPCLTLEDFQTGLNAYAYSKNVFPCEDYSTLLKEHVG